MSRGPANFAFGLRHPAGGWIRVGEWRGREILWLRNPKHLLPRAWMLAVVAWRQSQGGMGRGWLPDAGGLNDQSAWLMEAFGVLSAEESRIDKQRERAE